MKNIFDTIAVKKWDTNAFPLDHDVKFSMRMGELVPTNVIECLPGDVFDIGFENMLRFAPLISPVMHQVKVTTHYFFVPNRILWAGWESFITSEGDNIHPYISTDEVEKGTLGNYLGLPKMALPYAMKVSALPIAAYYKIWDDYYRAQQLEPEQFAPLVDGDNSVIYGSRLGSRCLKRAWMHDYFTSALPTAQDGDSVSVPLTVQDNIPVEYTPNGNPVSLMNASTGNIISAPGDVLNNTGPTPLASSMGVGSTPAAIDPNGTLTVDVQSDAVTINTLRRALKLQQFFEMLARGGKRYKETILSLFGVESSDKRLQRAEYIGGAVQNMVISEVLATAQDISGGVAVGQMAGHGISVGGSKRFRYRCEEHGFIIGIINVQPVTAYQQGVHRMFTRDNKYDYAFPVFGNIGEQEILNKEVYAEQPTIDDQNAVFGYTPRYAEYKYMNSRVAGDFADTLNFWHMGRIFETPPVLNSEFVRCNPTKRVFAVTSDSEDELYCHVFNKVRSIRKLPRYGIPSI